MIKSKFSFVFLITLLLVPLASAFGITAPYWETKPLVMLPGDSIDFALILQNMDGSEDVVLKAELVGGADIATLTDEELEYLVPLGRKDINVNLRVTIPEDALQGDNYRVGVSFKEISTDEEGRMVQMTTGIAKYVPIIIGPESEALPEEEETLIPEEEKGFPTAMVVLLLVIVVILGYIILKKKK